MEWRKLLSEERIRKHGERAAGGTDLRSEFEKDYHRIIGSASFRRLQDKTQVFPLDQSDFIRTRLTHSLEVSSYAKSLGQNIGEKILTDGLDSDFTPRMKEDICNIVQCAGLIHDIGNPPFGHFGEIAIREWFQKNLKEKTFKGALIADVLTPQMKADLYQFEGNAQAFRLVTKLHYLVDERGMNLTYGLLGTLLKYPISSERADSVSEDIKKKKFGYYYADQWEFEQVQQATGTNGNRHPLTFILEAADDIAYKTADIEDAFVKGFLSYRLLCEELEVLEVKGGFAPLGRLKACYARALERKEAEPETYAVKNWIVSLQSHLIACATTGFIAHYKEIMEGEYRWDLFYDTEAEALMRLLGDLAYRRVFTSHQIYKMEVIESAILTDLMDKFVGAAIKYENPEEVLDSIDERMISFISENYKNAYHVHSQGKNEVEKLYLRILLGTDYICGMTDSYAKRLYQELNGVL